MRRPEKMRKFTEQPEAREVSKDGGTREEKRSAAVRDKW